MQLKEVIKIQKNWWRCAGLNRSPKTNDQSLYMFSKSEVLAQARSLSKTTRRRKD